MQKNFIVRAKCGHVGKLMYIPMDFPIIAENGRIAASIARQRPGVKRNHPDAILSVTEVTLDEYKMAKLSFKNDLYWRKAKMGTKANQLLLFPRLEPETRQFIKRTNKKSTRKFRYRRMYLHDQSWREDFVYNYNVSV